MKAEGPKPTTLLDSLDPAKHTGHFARVPFPAWMALSALTLTIWAAITVNSGITLAAIVALPFCLALLWRAGEPPVLAFAVAMQWVQATAAIFYSNQLGITLREFSGSATYERATWLSLIAVVILAFGIRLSWIRCPRSHYETLEEEGRQINLEHLFRAYVVSFAAAALASAVAFRVPGLTQILFALTTTKWIFVFMLGFTVLTTRSGHWFLVTAVILEFGTGILGYFAGFKNVFYVLFLATLASPLAFQGKRLLLTVSIAFLVFSLGIVWTAVKDDYREFLNQDSKTQEILVPVPQRIDKLAQLVADLGLAQVVEAVEGLVRRISYVEFFAMTLDNVPSNVAYEHGALWLGTLKHIVTPRMLFPDKAVLDDSERTSLYTGIDVAGLDRGTSIGIGYIGESYIDFGVPGMFAPVFILGLFYGLIYRAFVDRAQHKLLGTGIASAILMFHASAIETSNIKLVGGCVTTLLILGILYKQFGTYLMGFVSKPIS